VAPGNAAHCTGANHDLPREQDSRLIRRTRRPGSPAGPGMPGFARKLTAWQKQHGRHDLPWQHKRDPYAIWVSEIMLQQTQVAAVVLITAGS
jgi:hypothetical protein